MGGGGGAPRGGWLYALVALYSESVSLKLARRCCVRRLAPGASGGRLPLPGADRIPLPEPTPYTSSRVGAGAADCEICSMLKELGGSKLVVVVVAGAE